MTAEPEPAAEPIACTGDERVEATGLTIVSDDGPAVLALGRCQVSLTDADLVGRQVGVDARGEARVVLRDSRVRGGAAAVVVRGDAEVELPGTEVFGEVRLAGSASSEAITEEANE